MPTGSKQADSSGSSVEAGRVALSATPSTASATTVTLTQIPAETAYHSLEDGVVEYCTTEAPATVTAEAPLEMMAHQHEVSAKPQELKSRIALNSAKLLQEQRVTNLHVKEIAQHLEQQNDLLQMIRRSQEVQACAQERQAQAMEGTQAALSALIQVLRPMIKDFRRFLQSNTPSPSVTTEPGQTGQQDDLQALKLTSNVETSVRISVLQLPSINTQGPG
ncbi:nuclear apoptosis-inducing factor 1 [Geospiza fortis]|uniref:Nuclear apoptosis-inducing factor 1 n=1 Tax=Geospiza fortis TaxID=48883 RepID=A0A8N5HRX0_GEOFO|nr:nuclear apoptosis-inducing factor 1 [Geospiza fortis]